MKIDKIEAIKIDEKKKYIFNMPSLRNSHETERAAEVIRSMFPTLKFVLIADKDFKVVEQK